MTSDATSAGMQAVYADDERLAPLIGPGGMFEVEEIEIDGITVRDFVRGPRTIIDIFHMGAGHGDAVHLVHEGERLTFAEVHAQARSLARELQTTFGVQPADRVVIAMRNVPDFAVAFWGIALCGAVVVPLNAWWTGPELGHVLEEATARIAFVDPERADRIREAEQPAGVTLIGARGAEADVRYEDLVAGEPIADDDIARPDRGDPATLLYTSGTTGHPKGALATHRAQTANLWNMAFANFREAIIAERPPAPPAQSTTISTTPLFHIGGIASILGKMMAGGKLILLRKWDLEEAMKLAVDEHVTNYGGVPTITRQILDRPGVTELGLDVRSFSIGGSSVPPDLPRRVLELFGDGVQIFNGYGLTETTSAVACNVGTEYAEHLDSVGRLNLTADLRVEGPDGSVLGVGEVGELCFRSPQNALGYWGNEAATKESFVDGWFHTGDVGYLDEDGFIHVVDRLKDVVIRGGENVYCAEVEGVLAEHPAVAQVAIVGLPEPVMGERVCAVVVPAAGATVTLDELREHAASNLAGFKLPEALHVVDELPSTATHKVAKNELRDQVVAAGDAVTRTW